MKPFEVRSEQLSRLEAICDEHDQGCLYLSLLKVEAELWPTRPIRIPLPEQPITPDDINHLFDGFTTTFDIYENTYFNLYFAARKLGLAITRIGIFDPTEANIVPAILSGRMLHIHDQMDNIIPSVILFRGPNIDTVQRHVEAATHFPNDMQRVNRTIGMGAQVAAVVTFCAT